jgi:hypothetical protein
VKKTHQLILVFLIAFFLSSPADAQIYQGWTDDITIISKEFWKDRGLYECNQVTFEVTDLGEDVAGHAKDKCQDGSGIIQYDTLSVRRGWRFFCVLTLHEWGHLVGKHHHGPSSNIMWPYINPYKRDRWCKPSNRP